MSDVETFPFAFDPKFALMLRPLGITPHNSGVEVDDETFRARFGRWNVETPLSNIAGFEITENYRWYKAIGIRGSLADHGLTFGTNADRGLCVKFVEAIDPLVLKGRIFRHPGLTVTVADPEGLADALRRRGVPG